jgi:hypothetical protein
MRQSFLVFLSLKVILQSLALTDNIGMSKDSLQREHGHEMPYWPTIDYDLITEAVGLTEELYEEEKEEEEEEEESDVSDWLEGERDFRCGNGLNEDELTPDLNLIRVHLTDNFDEIRNCYIWSTGQLDLGNGCYIFAKEGKWCTGGYDIGFNIRICTILGFPVHFPEDYPEFELYRKYAKPY